MKINKRFLSFFLAVLMVFSTFGDTVFALSNNIKTESEKRGTEIEGKVIGDKEVFSFTIPKKSTKKPVQRQSAQAFSFRSAMMMSPLRAPAGTTDTTVEVSATGLGTNEFDWSTLPSNEFKIIAKWETNDGQHHEKELTPAITSAGKFTYNVGWPTDGTMVGNASLVTSFNQNIEVRVLDTSSTSTGAAGTLSLQIDLTELAEPRADVKYVDPYGRELTDVADLPSASDTMPNVTAEGLTDVAIALPKTSKQINMRSSEDIDEDELHAAASGLTYKVGDKTTNDLVKIGGKDYKLDISAPDAKKIGTIKMVYQKDVVIPPTKPNSSDPVDVADGYVRLTFDANENKQDGIKGTHQAGAYAGQQKSYIDVKSGVQYDNTNLQKAIKALSTTGTKGDKTYTQDTKTPWTPAVPTDTTQVIAAKYNAVYTKSSAETITEAGGLKGVDLAAWVGDKLNAVFWKKGAALADNIQDADGKLAALLAGATVTDKSNRTTDAKGIFPGKLTVTFEDGSTLEVDQNYLYTTRKMTFQQIQHNQHQKMR